MQTHREKERELEQKEKRITYKNRRKECQIERALKQTERKKERALIQTYKKYIPKIERIEIETLYCR
jgi:hypothetical protein